MSGTDIALRNFWRRLAGRAWHVPRGGTLRNIPGGSTLSSSSLVTLWLWALECRSYARRSHRVLVGGEGPPRHVRRAGVHRSSKAIDEAAPQVAVRRRWTSPDPGCGMPVELSRGDGGNRRDVSGIGDRDPGK